jgi:hypothetical protein
VSLPLILEDLGLLPQWVLWYPPTVNESDPGISKARSEKTTPCLLCCWKSHPIGVNLPETTRLEQLSAKPHWVHPLWHPRQRSGHVEKNILGQLNTTTKWPPTMTTRVIGQIRQALSKALTQKVRRYNKTVNCSMSVKAWVLC